MFTLSIGDPWNGMSLYDTRENLIRWIIKWASNNPKGNLENLQIDDAKGNRCLRFEARALTLLPQGSYVHA